MSLTVIDIDDELLAAAAQTLGTSTTQETVNTALREVWETRRQAVALTRLRRAVGEGAFGLDAFGRRRRDLRRSRAPTVEIEVGDPRAPI
ncbi:type II toxin-antitoxin system VapB family antitoxin [Streptomyces sp. NPDC096323]|uniref:type II toxin-antitoxin system VapB family antitoxin n=1 Tax=Streptomyces sp. NPDC096323 TaxID=3155822 RepID=UPI0033225E98